MAFTKKNEEAVSPVIGVILMVAITVILAAVIAAFVFGMAGNVAKTKVIAITAGRPTSTQYQVTNMGGPDAGSLLSISVAGTNAAGTAASGGTLGILTGSTKSFTCSAGKVRVLSTGTFLDQTSQVLLDTYV